MLPKSHINPSIFHLVSNIGLKFNSVHHEMFFNWMFDRNLTIFLLARVPRALPYGAQTWIEYEHGVQDTINLENVV